MLASFFIAVALAVFQFFVSGAIPQAQNTIDGMVTTTDHRPVVNARVFLQNDGYSEIATKYTDGSGRFSFRGVPSGVYYVVVESAEGLLERETQRIEALAANGRASGRGGELFRVDFVMKPKKNSGANGSANAPGPGTLFYQDVPEVAKKEYAEALKSLEQNNADQGIASLKHAIELFPDYYDALDRLGAEYMKKRDFGSAMPLLAHAVEVNKNSWSTFYYLGVAHLELKQADEGVQALRRAVEINPNSVNANMRLGLVLATNKDTLTEAVQAFKKVAELAGKQIPDSYLYLAKLYAEQKKYPESAAALESYMKLIPPTEVEKREQYKKLLEQLKAKAADQLKQKSKS